MGTPGAYKQAYQLLVFNVEGVVTYKVQISHMLHPANIQVIVVECKDSDNAVALTSALRDAGLKRYDDKHIMI
jgi:hypothetical protein